MLNEVINLNARECWNLNYYFPIVEAEMILNQKSMMYMGFIQKNTKKQTNKVRYIFEPKKQKLD